MVDTSAKIEYDKDNDVLYVYRPGKVKFTISIGEGINLDIDRYGKIIAVEMLDASDILGVSKQALTNLTSGKLSINYKNNWAIVKIILLQRKKVATQQVVQIPYTKELAVAAA